MKKALLLILIPSLMTAVFYACDFGSNSNYNSEFQIDSLSLTVGKISEPNDGYFQLVELSEHQLSDTLDLTTLGFSVTIRKVSYITKSNHRTVSLISSAFAEPAPPHSKSKLSLISIYSDETIETETRSFTAGENLTAIFEASRPWEDWKTPLEMIRTMDEWYEDDPILLRLNTKLAEPLHQRFLFKLTMDDGSIFEMESPSLIIN